MNTGFFIHLTLATLRVLEAYPGNPETGLKARKAAEDVLSDLLVMEAGEPVTGQLKRELAPRALSRVDALQEQLKSLREEELLTPENFSVLEREYWKVRGWLEGFAAYEAARQKPALQNQPEMQEPRVEPRAAETRIQTQGTSRSRPGSARGLTERQERIIGVLGQRTQVQVGELQRLFPQVTKRTLRRDMDELLQKGLVERGGEWNAVFYQLKDEVL